MIVLLLVARRAHQRRSGRRGQRRTPARCSSSFLGALGGAFAALSASGLLGWVSTVSERHRTFSVIVLLPWRSCSVDRAGTEYWMTVAANIGVYAATAIGLNIVVGLAGLLDLGYIAFLGIGAFVAANLLRSGGVEGRDAPAVPDRHGHLRGGGALLRRDRGLADAAGARRLPRDRHARLRRDLPHRQNNIGGLTGGANAIPNIPRVVAVRHRRSTSRSGSARSGSRPVSYYYFLIVLLVAFVMLVFAHLKDSPHRPGMDRDPRGRGRRPRAMGIKHRPDQDPRVPHRRDPGRARGRVLRPQDRGRAPTTASGSPSRSRCSRPSSSAAWARSPARCSARRSCSSCPEKLREFSDYRLLLFGLGLILIMRLRPRGAHRRPAPAAASPRDVAGPDARTAPPAEDGAEEGGGAAHDQRRCWRPRGVTMRSAASARVERRVVRADRGRDHRADRAQRRGQDHAVQLPDRPIHADDRARSRCAGQPLPDDPARVTERGVARTFQNIRLFPNMTALGERAGRPARADEAEPVLVAAARAGLPARAKPRPPGAPRSCWSSSGSPASPTSWPATSPTATSGGWRSPVRWPPSPKVLLLDEPTAGMNAQETEGTRQLILEDPRPRRLGRRHRARHASSSSPCATVCWCWCRGAARRGHAGRRARRPAGDRGVPWRSARRDRRADPRGGRGLSRELPRGARPHRRLRGDPGGAGGDVQR